MRKNGGRLLLLTALIMLFLLLPGCAFSVPTDELYTLPKLPAEYESLEVEINKLLDDGAEHAAPTSGSNLQSVQMVDLDGDGIEEAVAFLRKAGDEKPMKIYFFKSSGERYEQLALIEGTASSIYSIAYNDLDGDGRREILVGFKSGTEVQVLSVYTLRGAEPLALLTTAYTRYAVGDLDGDGRQELTVFYSDEENRCMAACYGWNRAELSCLSTIELSFPTAELSRVTPGALSDGTMALYVTGVADNSVANYDILTMRSGVLQNITRGDGLTPEGEPIRFLSLYPADVNASGVIEVPEPAAFPSFDDEGEIYYRILWRDYSPDGTSEIVCRTFHNATDGWSLVLPQVWDEKVTVRRASMPNEDMVTFYALGTANEFPRAFLTISALTGDSREYKAARGDRMVLARQVDTVYVAGFLDGGDPTGAMNEETLKESFSLIAAEWTTGEN